VKQEALLGQSHELEVQTHKAGHTHLLERRFQLLPVMVLLYLLETQNLEGRQRPHSLHQYLLVTLFWGRKKA